MSLGSIVLLLLIAVPVAAVVALGWLAFVLAGEEPEADRSQAGPVARTLTQRMRAWLTDRPKRLDYRRDKRGRFRKVRRW